MTEYQTCQKCEGTGRVTTEETYEQLEDRCEERLDDIYGEVEICGYTYDSGRVLKILDPIAFRCAASELDDLEEDCDECDGTGEIELD